MSAADLTAGYRAAGGGKANTLDLTTAASAVAKHGLEQAELTRTRQEEFDKNRAEFKAKMQESYDQFVYEDNFDDTGILELDKAGEKLRNEIKANYLQTEWEYNNGLIDEATVRARNNNIKGQVNEFANLTGDIIKWGEEKAKLEAEGKDNRLNDFRADLLEAYSNQFKVKSTGAGLVMSTVIDGQPVDVPASQFKRVMQTDQAVDIEKDLDDLVKLGGLEEKIQGWGRDAKKITDYTRGEEGKALIKTRVDQWSAAETMDYALKRGLVTDVKDDGSGLPYLGLDAVFADEVQDDIKEAVYESMAQELDDRLQFKQKKEIYNDPYALAAIKEKNARARQGRDKSKVTVGNVVKENLAGDKYNATEFYPKDGKGIRFDHLLVEQGGENNTNMGRKFYNSLSTNLSGVPFPIDAMKSSSFKLESQNLEEGLLEIEMAYDFDEETLFESLKGMDQETLNRLTSPDNKLIPEDVKEKLKGNPEAAEAWLMERAKSNISGVFKYVPETLTDYNMIRSATGRDPLPQSEWNKYIAAKKKTAQAKGGRMSTF